MLEIELFAMGSRVIVTVDSERSDVRDLLEQAPEWFGEWERVLSRFDPASELSRWNASGRAGATSDTLRDVLSSALSASADSGGLVTPHVLGSLERAGYDRSFERIEQGRDRQVAAPPASDLRVDLGGFAKGWAADRVARRLGRLAPALVDVGGDMAVSGPRSDGSAWPVAIADPNDPEETLGVAQVHRGGVATSGRDHRRWGSNHRLHHIIDPRSGTPAETDVLAVTVLAPSALRAEVAAKLVLILGSQQGLAWIEARPELAAWIVRDDGSALGNLRGPS